ncbi:MAG TPA: riboflavin synthase [Blastocatellia bacterium]|nr:riboflavin synthase [Blastocatellia bacterium]HMV84782.1 riboflavin synthase [Blastocatellia bacterium]HMX30299.1 riboflavin synthase [Blastocatellia bacterium]HMY72759.1 riboflavin synthase [Blastocatellia bacterium]HNG30511.1 riboflavin synthase [Blastocatellia bacterium]
MFTGIIEELGTIRRITPARDGARLEVSARTVLADAKLGDSIAVNGVCLTVVDKGSDWFAADVSAETLRRTSLKQAQAGTRVNLERAMAASGRFGGHIVQGHVDGTGEFLNAQASGDGWVIRIGFPPELARYIVEKGSITVDGISLTVAALGDTWFEIAIIPHTWKVTNLGALARGAAVNLEVDILAKYVERMLAHHAEPKSTLTLETLSELGY